MINAITKEEEERYAKLQSMALDFAREGNTKELELMIRHGISVNLCTHKDDSLLMLATYNGHFETSKMLLKNGADIDRINQRGQTPLEGVCFKGNLDMVKLLVANGAKVNRNAFIYATMFGNKDVLRFLKEKNVHSIKYKLLTFPSELIVLLTSGLKKLFISKPKFA